MSLYSLCLAYQELGKPLISKANAEALFSHLKDETVFCAKSNNGLAVVAKDPTLSRDYLLFVTVVKTENPDYLAFSYERSSVTVESQNQFC